MKILCISGHAQNGKDTFANFALEYLRERGDKVLVTHYADLLKYMCKTFFDWNGEKDDLGRGILQKVGTDVIRKQEPNFWVEYIAKVLKLFPNEWNYIIIPDTRFDNECSYLRNLNFDVTHIRIERPNFDNGLTAEQKNHISETALDKVKPDYILLNNGTLENFRGTTRVFVQSMIVGEPCSF